MKRSVVWILVLLVAFSAAAVAKTPIRLVMYGDSFESWEKLAEIFNASHPDYELEVQLYPYAEYISKVTLMVLAGSPPDVMLTWAEYKPSWIEQGIIRDMTSYWEKSAIAQQAQIFPFMMEAAVADGKIYGVPYDYSFMSWILNADRLANAGLPEPDSNWTMDDFETYALRLTDPEGAGVYGSVRAGHWRLSNWIWSVNASGYGWLNEDRTQVTVTHPEHIRMLERWQGLINRGAVPAQGAPGPAAGDTWSGGYAMWEGWVHYAARLASSPYNWTMATFPKGAAGNLSFAQGHVWTVPVNAPDPDLSWVLLEWMLSPEGQRAIVQTQAKQPLSNDPELWELFFENVQPDKRAFMQDFVLNVIYGQNLIHNMEFWTSYPDVDRIMNRHLASVFALQVDPGTAMEQAAAEIRAVMGL